MTNLQARGWEAGNMSMRTPGKSREPLGPHDLHSLCLLGRESLVVGPLLRFIEAGSAAGLSEEMALRVPIDLHLWGYLIGDLGTRSPDPGPCTNVQISAGNRSYPVTMPLRRLTIALERNHWFPGLRHFRDDRGGIPSQLLQIVTLPYI